MIRVRFAAAPTGNLLIGGARVALANDLFARRSGGHLVLRLDDLDQARARPGMADQIMQDLHWFGIQWQEMIRQSERTELYRGAIERLERDKLIYPCFESEEELKAKEEFRRRRNQSTIYDRAMLSLTDKQRRDAEASGKRPHWRLKLSGRTLEWQDLILGRQRADLSAVSDPILVRADGVPTPVLASVADDIACRTTHVVRGVDSVANTAVQIELFEILGGPGKPVRFGHLPALAAGAGGRNPNSLPLRSLRNDGVEPSAITACMAGITEGARPFEDLARRFDLTHFAISGFAISDMLALNRRILGGLDFAAVADRLPPGATEAFWHAVRGHLDLLREARGWWDVVAGTIVPPVIEGESDLLRTAASLLPPEPWDSMVWTAWIGTLERATERRGETLLAPLQLALTGEDSGPDLADLLPLIGRSRAASRLSIAAA